jgi:serine/threonine-protein kinase RsbW
MVNDMEQANVQTGRLYTLQLPSKYESITLLEALIEEIADKYQVSDDTFANMMTCLNEAL